ncbi:MAG: hypothetical protein HFJ37_02265 [Clostridia bacterium]|nr:hypothetical protein [Clostridia bacterium]
MEYLKRKSGITLISMVILIIILLIIAQVSIVTLTGENGIITKASESKIMTALGNIKEKIELDKTNNLMENKNTTVEQLLADGKIKRIVQEEGENYRLHYVIKPGAYQGMQGLGKGTAVTLKDVFLIDYEFHVKYIDKSGKEYGDNIEEKILEDDTEIRFASKAFSEYVSKISGVTETELKFKWMKNQTTLKIADRNIDSLEDLVFFPNLTNLTLGNWDKNCPQVTTLDGVEYCKKLTNISILYGVDKDYTALTYLPNLKSFAKYGGNDWNNIIDALKFCSGIKNVSILEQQIKNMSRIAELGNLESLDLSDNQITKIEGLKDKTTIINLNLTNNQITKIEGLENLVNLKNLSLKGNQISDITPLSKNSSLIQLNLQENLQIDGDRSHYIGEKLEALNKIGEILDRNGQINLDIDKLGLFTNYKKLNLERQGLTTLEPLEGLTELTELILDNNQLTLADKKSQDILKSMKNLRTLSLVSNNITNISVINGLENLKTLSLVNNNVNLVEIEDIISNLNTLTVSNNSLKTIVNCDVNKITRLRIPYVGNLKEIPDLSKFTLLTELYIVSNPSISNFDIISKITSLQSLDLTDNNLQGRMIDFSKLTNLTNLNLGSNTLWTEDLEKLKALRNNTNLTINLDHNSIINANALLVLDTTCKINLKNNVNLTQESKNTLKERFGSNVIF